MKTLGILSIGIYLWQGLDTVSIYWHISMLWNTQFYPWVSYQLSFTLAKHGHKSSSDFTFPGITTTRKLSQRSKHTQISFLNTHFSIYTYICVPYHLYFLKCRCTIEVVSMQIYSYPTGAHCAKNSTVHAFINLQLQNYFKCSYLIWWSD